MAHPWMTFCLVLAAILAVCNLGPFVIVQRVERVEPKSKTDQ